MSQTRLRQNGKVSQRCLQHPYLANFISLWQKAGQRSIRLEVGVAFNLLIVLIAPKVEPYPQGAAIEFYKSKQGEAAIVEPLRFKSYAHLFYTRRQPPFTRSLADSGQQFHVHPEIPVYYAGKIQNREENKRDRPYLKKLYEKNGFVFYRRHTSEQPTTGN